MARPRGFSREGVLEKAIPVFWKHGFADASLKALELATGVNKSGLYAEFESKEALFLASLRAYLESLSRNPILSVQPPGWGNVEAFLKLGPPTVEGRKGCFAVASIRELAVLPAKADEMVTAGRAYMKRALIRNIEAERPTMDAAAIADLVIIFFTGLCIEQNLKPNKTAMNRKVESLMQALRTF